MRRGAVFCTCMFCTCMFWACVLCAVGAAVAQSTPPPHATTTTTSMDCCAVLSELYRYMAVVEGDRYKCVSPDASCPSLKLIRLFMNYTASTGHGVSVQAQGSNLIVSMPNNAMERLLVFAFFGRSASPTDSTDVELWLSYDTKNNVIVFEDSTCDYNNNVYTLLVLSSIVLLMFFIGVQVVRNEETDRKLKKMDTELKEAQSALPVLPPSTQLLTRPMRAVNLRFAHTGGFH
jgi:hypothetical protein